MKRILGGLVLLLLVGGCAEWVDSVTGVVTPPPSSGVVEECPYLAKAGYGGYHDERCAHVEWEVR